MLWLGLNTSEGNFKTMSCLKYALKQWLIECSAWSVGFDSFPITAALALVVRLHYWSMFL